ncbi:MAG: oxidoreductase [Planctomycetes bacterium]|nr:oxidoreductase [Planctomycetota bacterium]
MSTPPAFTEVPVTAVGNETPELLHLQVEPGADLAATYTTPGQYVQIQGPEGKPGFFAIASGPGRARFEFLIKRGGGIAEALAAKKPGDRVAISVPAGKGFPIKEAQGNDLYLIGAGSGLAPLRAAVHHVLNNRGAFKQVVLYYGARTAQSFAYGAELDAWLAQGIEVTRVCSQPAAGSWPGVKGRVQQALRERKPRLAANTCVFACGMKDMVTDLKALMPELGVPAERVFLNF